ncbi:hypothetical protein RSC2_01175 [Bacillus paralicheniformis]|nr:hypothetical protein RSC1_03727 [Bacillus paralicheniformis]BCE09379.1 hypothetical protein RSC2_01175 [Bacillus paralicheniformis]BCE15533.1 hypothetical protein RSC3_02889 [Bacillus paralicheniformis]
MGEISAILQAFSPYYAFNLSPLFKNIRIGSRFSDKQ